MTPKLLQFKIVQQALVFHYHKQYGYAMMYSLSYLYSTLFTSTNSK